MQSKSVITNAGTNKAAIYGWGEIRMLVPSGISPHASFGTVTSFPGSHGHELHSHAKEDEIIYIVSGDGLYLTDSELERKVHAGDCIFVSAGVMHSTVNNGSAELKMIIVYAPSGPDRALHLIDGFQKFSDE